MKIVNLGHLVWLTILTLIGMNILDMEINLTDMEFFSFPGTGLDRNWIIFGVDMSSSTKIDNRGKNIFWFWVKAQHKD